MSPVPEPATLHRVLALAGRAPSVENTQPWRWRRTATGVELHVDGGRRLRTDPSGRNAVISCGAALHHFRVAAAALGWESAVDRVPDRSGASLLARVELRPGTPPEHAASDLRAITERCTDRRRFTSWPVPAEPLHRLTDIASARGTLAAPLLGVTERFRAELLVSRAGESQVEASDGLIVLSDVSDDTAAWLRAGEGLSALWLAATAQGLSVVPLSQVVDVTETRRALRHEVLAALSHPLLLVRIGWQEISRSQLPRSERRPVGEIVDCGEGCEPVSLREAAPAG